MKPSLFFLPEKGKQRERGRKGERAVSGPMDFPAGGIAIENRGKEKCRKEDFRKADCCKADCCKADCCKEERDKIFYENPLTKKDILL